MAAHGSAGNPYDWQSHSPGCALPRAELGRVADTLRRGGSAVVLGGRGMGKSVFLRQVRTALEEDGSARVELISAPPAALTVEACLDLLARRLGVASGSYLGTAEIVDAYFARSSVPERLVLLFDEFDRYAGRDAATANPPGRGLFNDLEATRRDQRRLGILAAGSLGVFVVRDVLGSSFLARALHVHLAPFDRAAAGELAAPFAAAGRALTEAVVDTLYLAAGGIPALLTYGLQQLWEIARGPVERDVANLFTAFRQDHGEYLRDLVRAVADPALSPAPRRVLELVRRSSGTLSRATLKQAVGEPGGVLQLDLVDVLRLLEAAGLVRVDGSLHTDDPVHARPLTSIVNLSGESAATAELRDRFLRDLELLLDKLHRAGADFFRPGRNGAGKRLVPESVFSAHLALGFELLGWRAEREAQSAAGRTDVKLRRNAAPEVMLVEVKIWGRNDYREAHDQLAGYWTAEVAQGAVVQLTDADLPDWPERYRRECLDARGGAAEVCPPDERSSIAGRLESTVGRRGMTIRIAHYLVQVPRGRAAPSS